MGRRKQQQHQRRKGLHEALDRLELALRRLNGLLAFSRHLAGAEDAVEPALFEVLSGSLELAQGELAESYSQLRLLAAANIPHIRPD